MLSWRWEYFIYPYVLFSYGSVFQQYFNEKTYLFILLVSIILGLRLKK